MTLCLRPEEEARLSVHADAVTLFTYEEDAEGKRTLSVIPAVADTVRAHFASTEAPLTKTSLAALDGALRPFLSEYGYTPDRGNSDIYRVFRADPAGFSPKSPAFSPKFSELSTITTETVDNYQNMTTIDLPAALRAGCVAYGYVDGGRILSLAITHAAPTATAELTLETATVARGYGFGKAVLAALTADLVARGCTVIYRTRENNIPSVRAATAVGFHAAGLSYRYLGRRV